MCVDQFSQQIMSHVTSGHSSLSVGPSGRIERERERERATKGDNGARLTIAGGFGYCAHLVRLQDCMPLSQL